MIVSATTDMNELLAHTDHWGFVETPYGRMFLGKNDDGIATRYWHGQQYEPESFAVWEDISRHATVIDVGAHTGIYSLAAYSVEATRVISIEPYALNFARLNLNLRANGYPTEGCLNACASDHGGIVAFSAHAHPYYCTSGGRLGHHLDWPTYLVNGLTLDSLNITPSAVKIDVEGQAHKVLDGMTGMLTAKPDILIENENGLVDRLTGLGYRCTVLDGRNLYATVHE